MRGNVVHTLVAVFAASVLMLQHAPIVPVGSVGHEHCVHCTANYCTKGDCFCGHKHRARPDAHGGEDADAPLPGAHHGTSHSSKVDRHAGTSYSSGEAHDVPDSDSSHHSSIDTSLEPCGTPPSGIITIALDKFFVRTYAATLPEVAEHPSTARYFGASDQLVLDQFFRPPVVTMRSVG